MKQSGSLIQDWHLYKNKRRDTDTDKKGRKPFEGRGRVWGDTKEQQRLLATLEPERKAWSEFSPGALRARAWPCLQLNFRHLASRNVTVSLFFC